MSNEEFQKLVLGSLTELKTDMKEVKSKLNIIEEQTKNLTEFKQTIKDSALELSKKIS